ncbi:hypothetical protein [Aliarcobacter butzleri]|nr:hypothetical protein [Aliarcobacter butzleri]
MFKKLIFGFSLFATLLFGVTIKDAINAKIKEIFKLHLRFMKF